MMRPWKESKPYRRINISGMVTGLIEKSLLLFCALAAVSCGAHGYDPDNYFFFNDYCRNYDYSTLNEYFGPQKGNRLAVGNAILMYIFDRPVEEYEVILKRHFEESEKYDIPVLVELDPVTFWDGAPELWNWWDPTVPGYDPANRENVEWSSWSSSDAVKIGWLNWGSQIRLKPMANLFSPKYREAVRRRMDKFMTWTAEWYKSLPRDKKYLLGGVKITGELGFGVNNWYYPEGNSLYDRPAAEDPQTGIDMDIMPSRGVGQIGYASLAYSGIKTSGEITPEDIYAIEKKYAGFIADIVQGYGIPRGKLFSHSGGAGDDLAAAVQKNTCPTWSFYWDAAADPAKCIPVIRYLPMSDAPWWGCSEWNIGEGKSRGEWAAALENCYSIPGCRFISLFNYGTVFKTDADGSLRVDESAVEAIKARF